jgi:hypothetical protein
LYRDTRKTQETLYPDGKKCAMLRSTPQTGSFAKIAHRAIFKRSALAGTGTLTRFGFAAPAFTRSATLTPFIAGPLGGIALTPRQTLTYRMYSLINTNFNL